MALLNVNVYNELDPTDKVETNISFTNTTAQVKFNTSNAKGSKVAFPDISNFFNGRTGLTSFTFDSDFVDVPNSFVNCFNAFNGCSKLTSMPVVPTITVNAGNMYKQCNNMIAEAVCPDTVTDAHSMYSNCTNLIGEPKITDNVLDSVGMYWNCRNITGSPVASNFAVSAIGMYENCLKLTGDAAVGIATVETSNMYENCQQLDGKPSCPDSVVNANHMYMDTWHMTGDAECGASVVEALNMYRGCGIDGNAACGDSVVNAQNMFYYTPNLTGEAIVGASVVNAYKMYGDSPHVKRCANLPATVKNAVYMFRCSGSDSKAAIYTDYQDGDLYSGIYHWDSDIIENANGMWAASISGNSFCWPSLCFNAAHVKINQYYAGTTENTKTFNELKLANCPISSVTQTWNATHKVLSYGNSNLFFHADPTWDYHEETAKIDDIDRIEIDSRGSNGAWKRVLTNQFFLDNDEPYLFTECDASLYGYLSSTDRPNLNIYYKDGTKASYPYACFECIDDAGRSNEQYGRGIGNTAYQFGLPHLAYSEMDKKYPENIYFSGDWSSLLQDTKITKYPVFQRADGYVYENCWGKVTNFSSFFRNTLYLVNNANEFAGWNALDQGTVNCAYMHYISAIRGIPYLHENINNAHAMYCDCANLVGFCNIPNFTTDGVALSKTFWNTAVRPSGLEPFAEGVYHCNYDNALNVNDFIYTGGATDKGCGPTAHRNALHLYINHYYPGTTTETKTFKDFRDNTINGKKSKVFSDYECMVASDGFSNFWIHYDEDRDYMSKAKPVKELEIFWTGNTTDAAYYTKSRIASTHNGMHAFVQCHYQSIVDGPTYGIDYTAHFDDDTTYSGRVTPAMTYIGRATERYGWGDNSVVAYGFPWWVISSEEGRVTKPEGITYSGSFVSSYDGTVLNNFPWSEEYGHNFFYKVTNARYMFRSAKFGTGLTEKFDFSDVNFGMCTDCNQMFAGATNFMGDFSSANFDSAKDCESMFQHCKDITPPNLPNATRFCWFMNNSQGSHFDATGVNFGIDDGTKVNFYYAFGDCKNITGEIYFPSGSDNVSNTFRGAGGGDYSIRFNSDCILSNTAQFMWNALPNINSSIYLPNAVPTGNTTGMFGWFREDDSKKALNEAHIYDPYYQEPDKMKTSEWWSRVSNSGELNCTHNMFYAWTSEWVTRKITWTNYPDKGYLYNEQYNIYYHYSDITMTLIPLPDDVKALFADGTITKFVTD